MNLRLSPRTWRGGVVGWLAGAAMVLGACTGSLDAGNDHPHGLLPIDERNPIVVANDSAFDTWQGEYALLMASVGSLQVVGFLIGTSSYFPTLATNVDGWNQLISAARLSGMHNVPDVVQSDGPPLQRPANGDLEATPPNRSQGAQWIIDAANRLATPYRPLVIVTGARLTDIADAYLLDHTLPDRLVVVSSLGFVVDDVGHMLFPNGELDPWADTIVVQRFRYVQVSAFYDQTQEIPEDRIATLPKNAFGTWMAQKQSRIADCLECADQVGVAAVALPDFATSVDRRFQRGTETSDAGETPLLDRNPDGHIWLVQQCNAQVAMTRFSELLQDPAAFGP